MMPPPRLGERPLLGTWVKLGSVEVVEILALAGLDFVIIDLEHAPLAIDQASILITLADARGLSPFVRVSDTSPPAIGRILDAGAAGLLVPHVDTADDAAAIVDAMRFPPVGHRGSGRNSRAGSWGAGGRDDYTDRGAAVLCIPQIESTTAVDNVDAILAVDGVDAVFLGAGDLSLSLGTTPADPDVRALLDRVRSACKATSTPWGAAALDGTAARRQLDAGCGFVTLSNDTSALLSAMRSMVADATGSGAEA